MSEKFPPRVWISEEELNEMKLGSAPAQASHNFQIHDDIEYLSLAEHEAKQAEWEEERKRLEAQFAKARELMEGHMPTMKAAEEKIDSLEARLNRKDEVIRELDDCRKAQVDEIARCHADLAAAEKRIEKLRAGLQSACSCLLYIGKCRTCEALAEDEKV